MTYNLSELCQVQPMTIVLIWGDFVKVNIHYVKTSFLKKVLVILPDIHILGAAWLIEMNLYLINPN